MNLDLGLYGLVLLWVAIILSCFLWIRRRRAGAFDIEADSPPPWGRGDRLMAVVATLAASVGIILSLGSAI